jgi:hypothetical protein
VLEGDDDGGRLVRPVQAVKFQLLIHFCHLSLVQTRDGGREREKPASELSAIIILSNYPEGPGKGKKRENGKTKFFLSLSLPPSLPSFSVFLSVSPPLERNSLSTFQHQWWPPEARGAEMKRADMKSEGK